MCIFSRDRKFLDFQKRTFQLLACLQGPSVQSCSLEGGLLRSLRSAKATSLDKDSTDQMCSTPKGAILQVWPTSVVCYRSSDGKCYNSL